MTKHNHSYPKNFSGLLMLLLALVMVFPANSQGQKDDGTNDAKLNASVPKRDPFWPVGYMPESVARVATVQNPQAAKPAVDNSWDEAMKKVTINGVSSRSDDEFFAVINGEIKSVGDTVMLNHEGTVYTWAVESINPPGSVKLRRVSAR